MSETAPLENVPPTLLSASVSTAVDGLFPSTGTAVTWSDDCWHVPSSGSGQLLWETRYAPAYDVDEAQISSSLATCPPKIEGILEAYEFADKISSAYKTLIEKQEPLGREFEAAWNANRDALYEY